MAKVVLQAIAGGVVTTAGGEIIVRVGQLAHADHPVAVGNPHLFGPLRVRFATAESEPEPERPRRSRKPAEE